jgi:capsular polysaccharide export protein
MAFLFITRKNVHARYYKALTQKLSIDSDIHIMGRPKLAAFSYFSRAFAVDFSYVLASQLRRKRARNNVWNNAIVSAVYSAVMVLVERLRYAKYLALFDEKKPEYLVIWNGNKLPNMTVAMAAKEAGIKQFYYENGLLPGTTSLDPKGVNYASSLSNDPRFYLQFDPQNTLPFSAPDIIPRANHKKRSEFNTTELPSRYLFVPFQVPHDTQIACYSPWIESMEMFYDEVIKAVTRLNDPQLKVVFKEHPSWHKHYESLYHRSPIALFANGNQTSELIDNAEAVLTINSTVGLESLLLNKRVITLGEACYNIEGLVLTAQNSEELAACVAKIQQNWQADTILRDKFFTYLKHVYCLPGAWRDCSSEHVDAVEKRLLGNDQFSVSVPHTCGFSS